MLFRKLIQMLTELLNFVDNKVIFRRNPWRNSWFGVGFACFGTTSWPHRSFC